jgi:GT2 family glycosyltransferase
VNKTAENPKPQIVLVLGMHRSGTSLAAQLVARAGVWTGEDLMPANLYNTEGYWEYNPLVRFHEKLLKFTGNVWYAPVVPFSTERLLKEFGKEAEDLVHEMDRNCSGIWMWKDPRMITFMPFWERVMEGRHIIRIIPVRHPAATAESLFRRDKMPAVAACALWEYLIRELFTNTRLQNAIRFDFEAFIADPKKSCDHFFHQLRKLAGPNLPDVTIDATESILKQVSLPKPGVSGFCTDPAQIELYETIQNNITDATILLNNPERSEQCRKILDLYYRMKQSGFSAPSAQLYYAKNTDDFSEAKSISIPVSYPAEPISFHLPAAVARQCLRFDPLNSFARLQIKKISFLRKGIEIPVTYRLSSNGVSESGQIYLFDTCDPQITLFDIQPEKGSFDEICFDVNYMSAGLETAENLIQDVKQKHAETEAATLGQTEKINSLMLQILAERESVLTQKAHIQNQDAALKMQEKQIQTANEAIDELEERLSETERKKQESEYQLYILRHSRTYKFSRALSSPFLLLKPGKLIHSIRFFVRNARDAFYIRSSGLFNARWYCEQYPDIRHSRVNPGLHYLRYGGFEGRNPGPDFDSRFYLENYPDVKQSGINPLLHYIKFGLNEGRLKNAIVQTSELPLQSHRLSQFVLRLLSKKNLPFRETGKKIILRIFPSLRASYNRSLLSYDLWINRFDTLSAIDKKRMTESIGRMPVHPLISVLMPVYNPKPEWLKAAIDSVISQIYPHWELCIADDASTNPRIREILTEYQKQHPRIKVVFRETNGHICEASNSALELVSGEYTALLDHDDLLPEHAFLRIAEAIHTHPEGKLFYSDEDKIDSRGIRSEPYFKCDWNRELFYSQNFISHLGVYRSELMKSLGGFRPGFEGSQDYDLALRYIEKIEDHQIIHISGILYHWRKHSGSTAQVINSKDYAYTAGERALNEHFVRDGRQLGANIQIPGLYRLRAKLPDTRPLISVIIPTRDKLNLLKTCIDSIKTKTTYPNYEILLIDNGSAEKETLAYYQTLLTDGIARIIEINRPFNFSELVNQGVAMASGEYACLLNNDIEVITPDWLQEMLGLACQPGVGAIGAKLYYPNNTIQHAGVILGIGGIGSHAHKGFRRDAYGYFGRAVVTQEFTAVTAACMLIRKNIFQQFNGFNEAELSVAFNDVDFCLRLKAAGYRNLFTPYAELWHHESASRGTDLSVEKRVRFEREIRFMKESWGAILQKDPAYNLNLTLNAEDFSLDWTGRMKNNF